MPKQTDKKSFNSIDLVKFIMALFVVAIHLHPFSGKLYGFSYRLYESIVRLAVPFFFLTTGFFLGKKMKSINKYSKTDSNKIKETLYKTLKLYLIFTVIYLPLTLYDYINNNHGVLFDVVNFFRYEIFIGEHFNSWILWYLLSCFYGLLLIFLLYKKLKIKNIIIIIIIIGLSLYLFGFFVDLIMGVNSSSSIIIILQKIISSTFVSGRIFQSVLYLSIGMYLSKAKQFNAKNWMYITFIIFTVLLNAITPDELNKLFILPSSVCVFILCLKIRLKDFKIWPFLRFLSEKLYFYHLWIWSIICFIINDCKIIPIFGMKIYLLCILIIITISTIIYTIKNKKKNAVTDKTFKINLLTIIIGIINLVLVGIIMTYINKLNILPFKYIVLLIICLLLYFIITTGITMLKNKIVKGIAIFLTICLIIITGYAIKYSDNTNHFLNKYFNTLETEYENKYFILVKDDYKELGEFNNKKLGYYINTPEYEKALDELDIFFEKKEYDEIDLLVKSLENNEVDGILIDELLYNFINENKDLNENVNKIDLSNYKKLYTYTIKIEDELIKNSDVSDAYNIYIGGLDFTEKNTDFNMIITINKNTHKILLTSIPRDYYVDIYGKDGKDLLGYAGIWGIGTSVKTIENLFGINIDYYLRIHTTNLVDLVNALGGVEFCSNYSFKTTHALILGSYDDTHDEHLYVRSGCHTYNGIEILTIARERLQVGGDRVRQKNCQDIIINIFKKMISTNTLANYDKILNALGNSYTTNLSKKVVQKLIKDIINNPNVWEFIKQSVDGESSMNYVHFSNYIDHTMNPDMSTVESATKKINEVLGR